MTEIFGAINVEGPAFTVAKKTETFEVRQYAKQIRASYVWQTNDPQTLNLEGNEGSAFRKVAGYIFGGNTKRDANANGNSSAGSESIAMTAPVVTHVSESIAMTAPVVTETSGLSKKMSFIMPATYTSLADMPTPNDASVVLEEVPPHTVAVIKFSWRATKPLTQQKEHELRQACAQEGVQLSTATSDVCLMQYNPPWCLPFLRTNEIAIRVIE